LRGLFWKAMFWLVVGLIVVIAVFPFYYAVLSSLETGTQLFEPNVSARELLDTELRDGLGARSFVRSVFNSVFIAGSR
jgi:trehalose/maltose transport system permease protein